MKICNDCFHVFDDDEIAHWQESRGEFWGVPCTETVSGCPHCRGDYEKAVMCENCGEWFLEDELDENYLCEDCRE